MEFQLIGYDDKIKEFSNDHKIKCRMLDVEWSNRWCKAEADVEREVQGDKIRIILHWY